MGHRKKRTKKRKRSGTPKGPRARGRLNKMSMGCLLLLLLLLGFLVLPRLLSGSG